MEEARKFQLKDGGLVAMAEAGVIQMGCNPFGFVCSDCGTVHSLRYQVRKPTDGDLVGYYMEETEEELLLNVAVTRDEEETLRYREHLGIPGTAQDVAREFIAVDELVNQALASVLPTEEKLEDSVEKRVAQLITVLGMHREVLANYRTTLKHMVKGIGIARDAVMQELESQKLISVVGQSQWLLMALDSLNTMVPAEEKPEKSKIIMLGGGRS